MHTFIRDVVVPKSAVSEEFSKYRNKDNKSNDLEDDVFYDTEDDPDEESDEDLGDSTAM